MALYHVGNKGQESKHKERDPVGGPVRGEKAADQREDGGYFKHGFQLVQLTGLGPLPMIIRI